MATELKSLTSDQIKSRNIATLKKAVGILEDAIEVEESAFKVDTKMVEKLKATKDTINKAIGKANSLFDWIVKKNKRLLVMTSKDQYSLNNLYSIAIKAAKGDKSEIERLENEQLEDLSTGSYSRGFWSGLTDDSGQIGGVKASSMLLGLGIASMVAGLIFNPGGLSTLGALGDISAAAGGGWMGFNAGASAFVGTFLPLLTGVLKIAGMGLLSPLGPGMIIAGIALVKKFGRPLMASWAKTFSQGKDLKAFNELFNSTNTTEIGKDLEHGSSTEAIAYKTITHLYVADKAFDVENPQEMQSFVNEINKLGVKATYNTHKKTIVIVDAIEYGSGKTYQLSNQADLGKLNNNVERFITHSRGPVVHLDGIAFDLLHPDHITNFKGKADMIVGLTLTGNSLEDLGILKVDSDNITLNGKAYSLNNPEELKKFETDFGSFAQEYTKHEAEVDGYGTLSLKEEADIDKLIAIAESAGAKIERDTDPAKWFMLKLETSSSSKKSYNVLNPQEKADLIKDVDTLVNGLGITVDGKPYNLGNETSRNALIHLLQDLDINAEFIDPICRIEDVGIDITKPTPESRAQIQAAAQTASKTRKVTADGKPYDLSKDADRRAFVTALKDKGADIVLAGNVIVLNGCPYDIDKVSERHALANAADGILKGSLKIQVGRSDYDFSPEDGDADKKPSDRNGFVNDLKVLGITDAEIVGGKIKVNGNEYDLTDTASLLKLAQDSNALFNIKKRSVAGKEFDLTNNAQAQEFANTLTALGVKNVTFTPETAAGAKDAKVEINGVDVLTMSLKEIVGKVQEAEKQLEENKFTIAGQTFEVKDDASFKQFTNALVALGADTSMFTYRDNTVMYDNKKIDSTTLSSVIGEISKASNNVTLDEHGKPKTATITIAGRPFNLSNVDELDLFKQTLTALGVKPEDVLDGEELKINISELGEKISEATKQFENKKVTLGDSELEFGTGKGSDLSKKLKVIGINKEASALEAMSMDDLVNLIEETNNNFKKTVVVAEAIFKLPGEAQELDNTLTALGIDPKEILDDLGMIKAGVNLETLASKIQEAEKNITTQKDGAGNVTSYAVITVAGKAFTIKDDASLKTFKNALLALGINKEDVDKIKIDGDSLKFDGQPLTNATLTTLASHVKTATDKFATKEFIIGGSKTTFDTLNKTNLQNKLKVIGIKLDDSIDLENLSLNDELVGLFDKAQENFGRVIVISDKSYNIPEEASNLKVALTALGFDQVNLDNLFSGDSLKNGVDLNYLTQKIQEAEKSLTGYTDYTRGSPGIEHPVRITISGHPFELRNGDDSFKKFINALKVYGVPQDEIQKISFDGQLKYDGRTLVGDDFAKFMEQVGEATKNKSNEIIYVAGESFDLKVDGRAKDLANTLTALGVKNVVFDESAKKVTIDGKDVLSMDQATISEIVKASNNFAKEKPTIAIAGKTFDLANDKDLSDFKKALTALGFDYKEVITEEGKFVDGITLKTLVEKINNIEKAKENNNITLGNSPYSASTEGDPSPLSNLQKALKVIGIEKDDTQVKDLDIDQIIELADTVDKNKGKVFVISDKTFTLPDDAQNLADTLKALGAKNVEVVKNEDDLAVNVTIDSKPVDTMDLSEIVNHVESAEKALANHEYTVAGKTFKLETQAEDLAIALKALGVKGVEYIKGEAETPDTIQITTTKTVDEIEVTETKDIKELNITELTEIIKEATENLVEYNHIKISGGDYYPTNPTNTQTALSVIGLEKTEDQLKDLEYNPDDPEKAIENIIALEKETTAKRAEGIIHLSNKEFKLAENAQELADALIALGIKEVDVVKGEDDKIVSVTIEGKDVREMPLDELVNSVKTAEDALANHKYTVAGKEFDLATEANDLANTLKALGVEGVKYVKGEAETPDTIEITITKKDGETETKETKDIKGLDVTELSSLIKGANENFKNNTFTVAGKPFTLPGEKTEFVATLNSLNVSTATLDLCFADSTYSEVKNLDTLISNIDKANQEFDRSRVCVSTNNEVEYFELSNANELDTFKQTLTALGLNPDDYFKDGKVNVEKLATLSSDIKEKQDSKEIILDGVTYDLKTEDGRTQLATAAQEIFGTKAEVSEDFVLKVYSSKGTSHTPYDLKNLSNIIKLVEKANEKNKGQTRDSEGNILYPAPTTEQRTMIAEYKDISLAQIEIAIRTNGSITVGEKTISEKSELEAIKEAKLTSIAYMGHEAAAKSRDISNGMGADSTIEATVDKFNQLSPEALEMAIQLFTADDATREKFASMAGSGSNIQAALNGNVGRRDACLNILLIVKHKKELEKSKGISTSAVETKKAPTREELLACFDLEGNPKEGVIVPDNLKGLTPDQVKQMLEWLPEVTMGDSE